MFKDVKTGYPIHILHKTEDPYVSQGKVTSMPTTHLNNAMGQYNPMSPQTMQMMVDVTIEDGGVTKTYTIPESSSITYANDLVLAVDRDLLIREVESQKSMSEDHVKQTPIHEKRIQAYERILSDLNPVFREKKETDARFGKIETDVKDMRSMLKDLISKLS